MTKKTIFFILIFLILIGCTKQTPQVKENSMQEEKTETPEIQAPAQLEEITEEELQEIQSEEETDYPPFSPPEMEE